MRPVMPRVRTSPLNTARRLPPIAQRLAADKHQRSGIGRSGERPVPPATAGLVFWGAHWAPALNPAPIGLRAPYDGKADVGDGAGRCFDYLLSTTPPLLPRCSPPLSSMKRAIVSTPSPARRLLNTKGRVPRMRLASRSMTASEAPT